MNKLEEILRNNAPRPRRELRVDFTKYTLSKLADKPQKRGIGTVIGDFTMRLKQFTHMHKPAAIALAVIGTIVISGTATAATLGWPNVLAIFGGEQHLSDGSRLVRVDTKNCRFITALNVTKEKTHDSVYYYRVKPDSKLTNQQITVMVQGQCDIEAQATANTALVRQIMGDQPNDMVGGYIDNVITAITPTTVSVSMSGVDGTGVVHTATYGIAPDAVVIQNGQRLSLTELHVGDHIAVIYHASGDLLTHSETTAPWTVTPETAKLAIITKNSSSITASMEYQRHNRNDFEEVTPCSNNPTGYCTIRELNQK